MTPEQAAAFSARLNTDVQLQQKTDEVKLLLLGVKEAVLEERLSKFHSHIVSGDKTLKKTGRIIPFNRKWMAAASVFAIVSLSVWWFITKEDKYEKVYAAFYTQDPGLITAMGSSEDYTFEKAMVEYKEGNYAKAIEAWASLKTKQPQSDTLNYFLGVAYLAIDKTDTAKALLSAVAGNSNKPFYKEASWYLGLILLKDGGREKALALIRQSGNSKSNDLINAVNKK